MTAISKALESIVSGTNHFCCLCLNICNADDLISSTDEENIVRNNKQEYLSMSGLVLTVLGSDFTQYLKTLENICQLCVKSLVNCYTFIQSCTSNAAMLNNVLEGINTAVENITKPENEQSLYVSVSLDDFSTQCIYDSKKVFTTKSALDRYKVVSSPKTKVPRMKHDIKDMLHNPSNQHIFQCKVCLKICKSMCNLRKHFKDHTDKKNQYSKHPKTYRSKVLTAHSHRKVTCDECGKMYNSLNSLKIHQMEHKTLLVCPNCGRTYKNKITFRNHVDLNICKQERRHSPSKGKFTCDYCNKKYTQKMSLRVHIQFEHGNYKAHICEWCGKKFWAQSRLKAHIVKHTRERNFSCSVCDRKFVTKESLLYHTRLHTGEKPYKCPECSSRFLSASRRSDHVKRYHGGAAPGLKCDVCHGMFRSNDVLLKHKKTHEEKRTAPMETIVEKIDAFKPKKINTIPQTNIRISNNINKGKTHGIKNSFQITNIHIVTDNSVENIFVQDIIDM